MACEKVHLFDKNFFSVDKIFIACNSHDLQGLLWGVIFLHAKKEDIGMDTKETGWQQIKKIITLLIATALVVGVFPTPVFAENEKTEVLGNVYEFGKKSHYEFHESDTFEKTGDNNTYGTFYVSGNIAAVTEKSGVPAYEVADEDLKFYYNYSDTLLNAEEDSWHLIDDESKKVADITLKSKLLKGAIILQTSKDRKNWVNVETIYNAFSDTPIRTDSIYSSTDVQLINGCFYRVIVAYELSIRTEKSNFLFINTDKYDYKKCAEVYEFYAHSGSDDANIPNPNETYSLGERVRVKNFDGYFGEELIDKKDPHYGWELGNFFVSGYTDEVANDKGDMVFLKNIGDKVTLWFNLKENINALNGNNKISVTADTEGYDQYFETTKMDFGRGVLIIRYTDHNNVKSEPTIYTNYLEANAVVGADTKVQLFEEGDYEVALDYEITSDELIDKVGHYRIFFKFSVRNSNCMIYPFDVKTGNELTNSSMTENGFRLDLAKSRYLKINIKREMLKDSADGLVEDTRFNGAAKDGAEYTDEGIYTITVSNQYTGVFTTKKIYVGTNNVLRAHMTTGLSIMEINNLVADGATISDDGTIQLPTVQPAEEPTVEPTEKLDKQEKEELSAPAVSDELANNDNDESEKKPFPVAVVIVIAVCILIVVAVFILKKKQPVNRLEANHDEQGGPDR